MGSSAETLLDATAIDRCVRRMASEVLEQAKGVQSLVLVGVRRGGIGLSRRLAREIESQEQCVVPVGSVDIALYRDDAATALPSPKIGPSEIPFQVSGKQVLLVDDVLQTGRTVRAAIDCLLDHGRPARILLAVLIDRRGRELPIAADTVGRELDLPRGVRVEVRIDEDSVEPSAVLFRPRSVDPSSPLESPNPLSSVLAIQREGADDV
ncbi:MAG: bifunctional pyr operon transcriptional regulator/uracil phosphoribosyltransferase PyrR [Myxococcota bacterium]